ncbi:hypothetical protein DMUE_3211 [Dictyocoela muelleri]|nr:hypothetical protein DMUE_3211 [Dictyocoela muelleri]
MHRLKQRAQNTSELPIDVITSISSELDDSEINSLPKLKSLSITENRTRNKNFIVENKVIDDIPEILKRNLQNEQFLLFDSGLDDKERIVFFASDIQINFLENHKYG